MLSTSPSPELRTALIELINDKTGCSKTISSLDSKHTDAYLLFAKQEITRLMSIDVSSKSWTHNSMLVSIVKSYDNTYEPYTETNIEVDYGWNVERTYHEPHHIENIINSINSIITLLEFRLKYIKTEEEERKFSLLLKPSSSASTKQPTPKEPNTAIAEDLSMQNIASQTPENALEIMNQARDEFTLGVLGKYKLLLEDFETTVQKKEQAESQCKLMKEQINRLQSELKILESDNKKLKATIASMQQSEAEKNRLPQSQFFPFRSPKT